MANATWLADALREALKATPFRVVEHDGWQTRGRPGAFTPKGVLLHHTGSNPRGGDLAALSTVLNGRLDERPPLPGPLAQLMLARNGDWHVIAAGRCNHAGKGKWRGDTSGNTDFIGVEAENNGAGEPWPDAQLESYTRGVAGLLDHMKADESMAAGHKEYALPVGRKVDPTIAMIPFREHVANLLHVGTTQPLAVLPIPAVDRTHSMLLKGASGASVKQLQKLLGVAVDGDFGPKTETAVKAFQKAHGLTVDGKVGPATWTALGVK